MADIRCKPLRAVWRQIKGATLYISFNDDDELNTILGNLELLQGNINSAMNIKVQRSETNVNGWY